ncbi:RagB/SusD family nutrient uptake outer membrane protein [Sphingobacterium tabacisoli]|uniref:RagB/SusD family nutrient uptake outer membrane protein n=1 Tax=Sphingobacterium tabacisoli TaxID=2044855 RepID=A0ABW5L4X0_9SPHI|nr:RagB/SusD family nutrient uptake outer membrane protein [Sphingobacterium tabacisoli]
MKKVLCYCHVIVAVMMISCERFLDEKMLKSLTVPTTIQDLEALMKATGKINISVMPSLLEMGADDYVLSESGFNSLTEFERLNYGWKADMDYQLINVANEWSKSYEIVLIANTVLEYLPKVEGTENDKNRLRGEALFLRSWCFYNLAQVYCPIYIPDSDNSSLGIPLRVHSDLNVGSVRATVGETYAQIVSDLTEATELLSKSEIHVTRPNRTAGLALLARVYLAMSDYDNALRFSREALQTKDDLMDYNTIKVDDRMPFERFNKEVLYHSTTAFMQILNPTISYVNPELIDLYEDGDLRRRAFITPAKDGYFTFKGSYDGTISGSHFVGLTTAELYLILAEALVGANKVKEGVDVLNDLLKKRWDKNSFVPLSIHDKDEALKRVFDERRKELVFRGVRWTDIRRLNLDSRFAKALTRTLAGETFTLPPKDPRFVYLIPQDVIHFSGITQNQR